MLISESLWQAEKRETCEDLPCTYSLVLSVSSSVQWGNEECRVAPGMKSVTRFLVREKAWVWQNTKPVPNINFR